MVRTEKYKDSVMAITNFCRHINRNIGNYQTHYLSEDYHFTVDVGNGTLKIPIHLAAGFNEESIGQTTDLILKIASGFKAKNKGHKSNKKIREEWQKLFSFKFKR